MPTFFKRARFPHSPKLGFVTAFTLLGAVLNLAPAEANYRAKAIEATDFIQRTFYDAKAGLYRGESPINPKSLPYDVMWANGVQFSVLTMATRYEPKRYRDALYGFSTGLERYWDKDAAIPGFDAYFSSPNDDDKYYDDNAWLVLDFTDAFRVTKDTHFLDWAKQTQKFVLSGWDDQLGGGIYWHQQKRNGKNTCANGPTAAAALELYDLTQDPTDLDWAKRIYNWTNSHLQDKDGLYWDNQNLNGKVQEKKWTYNTALMLRTNVKFWQLTKDPKYQKEARRIADASLQEWVKPDGSFDDDARFNNWLSEALLMTYEATGDIKYLNAVRRHADFGHRYVRDIRDGGYFDKWNAAPHAPDSRKTLIENAGAARILWMLEPYLDVEELRASGEAAQRAGDFKKAADYFQQALASTAGDTPTQAAIQ